MSVFIFILSCPWTKVPKLSAAGSEDGVEMCDKKPRKEEK